MRTISWVISSAEGMDGMAGAPVKQSTARPKANADYSAARTRFLKSLILQRRFFAAQRFEHPMFDKFGIVQPADFRRETMR
jgi:hypothetical protein